MKICVDRRQWCVYQVIFPGINLAMKKIVYLRDVVTRICTNMMRTRVCKVVWTYTNTKMNTNSDKEVDIVVKV